MFSVVPGDTVLSTISKFLFLKNLEINLHASIKEDKFGFLIWLTGVGTVIMKISNLLSFKSFFS